uniref:Uncharacterized protein n=1 Tax=Aegilops tauschii TaxID=37682 RepID=M8BC99_AEGTA
MGHGASCGRPSEEVDFFGAAQSGDLARLAAAVSSRPSLLRRTTLFDRLSALHIAAAHGHLQVVSMALDLCVEPDVVNRHKQILMFDSSHGRTCLHYAAYYGHSDCLRAILTAARTAPVSQSWGYARFVNVRDDTGATPLHLAARQGWRRCVHVLLENGAIVSASSGAFGFPGSTPLHLAARGGSLDCVRQLLSWGADRLQRDSVGRIPYEVAVKRGHVACAALLNPSSAEPLVWPSPLKFISELEPDAKALLEAALMEANREREKRILKGAKNSLPSPSHSDDGATVSERGWPDMMIMRTQYKSIDVLSLHVNGLWLGLRRSGVPFLEGLKFQKAKENRLDITSSGSGSGVPKRPLARNAGMYVLAAVDDSSHSQICGHISARIEGT